VSDEIKNFCLLHETEVLERRVFSLFNVGINHFAWSRIKKQLVQAPSHSRSTSGNRMVRHLFLKKICLGRSAPAPWRTQATFRNRFAGCDYFICAGEPLWPRRLKGNRCKDAQR
jgi:hypothetical protein